MKTIFAVLLLSFVSAAHAACSGSERTFTLTDPVDGSPWAMTSKEYLPSAAAPVVFILPPIVGETVLDRNVASKLCGRGMAVYILHATKEVPVAREQVDLSIHDESYVRAAGAVRAVIGTLQGDARFTGRYGILGMSLGGLLAAYVAGVEPQITASVLIAGAGNVAGILSTSDQELVVKQRNARLQALGLPDVAAYEAALRAAVHEDPLFVAKNIPANSSYLFICNSDTTVPTRFQRELRAAIKEPLVFTMNSAHTAGLIKAGTLHVGKMASFLAKRLKD